MSDRGLVQIVLGRRVRLGSASETFSLSGTGTAGGATVTPYLTNSGNSVAPQHTTTVGNGSFTATIPGLSLVTYVIAGH